jgi:hypothetical protein
MREYASIAIAAAPALILAFNAPAIAEPCNPVIDGTYCATEMRRANTPARSPVSISPVQSLGGSILGNQDQPATFGAITFQGNGQQCIGLLRRGRCN